MNHDLCPKVELTLNLLGKKWVALIIYTLHEGPMKFSQIEKYIPKLSARLLTERLKELEKLSIIKKAVLTDDGIKIKYELTRKGYDLADSFKQLENWAEKWN